jgi:excisionase family DNA binding protein
LPVKGKIPVEDLCTLLNIKSHATVKKLVREKQIRHHKIGHKWVIDLADFWGKTAQNTIE